MVCAMFDHKGLTDSIKQILSSREPEVIHDPPSHLRHAAVLIPLLVEDGVHKVLFTKRTDRVEHHKGQISFPGGSMDKEDKTEEETALRESHEEIGLLREDVEILGRIDDALAMASDFIIHPYVGRIPALYDFSLSEVEVKRLIKVPWDMLVADNLKQKTYSVESEGKIFLTPAFEYNGDLIWGATARMLKNFIEILGCR